MHCAVVAVRLSRAGLPLAVLSDSTAHALHLGMRAWMRVADSAFALSSYLSLLSPSAGVPGQTVPEQHQACTLKVRSLDTREQHERVVVHPAILGQRRCSLL